MRDLHLNNFIARAECGSPCLEAQTAVGEDRLDFPLAGTVKRRGVEILVSVTQPRARAQAISSESSRPGWPKLSTSHQQGCQGAATPKAE